MTNHYSFRLLAIGTMLIVALTALAQQTAAGPGATDKDEHGQRATQDDVPIVGQMMKVLTEKLDLTGDQQARITPILQELHDTQQKLVQDKSLSREERLAKVRPQRYKADKLIREFLNDDQKQKLDQYLHGPHGEMHGNLSGATPLPPAPAQQTATGPGNTGKDEHGGMPAVQEQLKVLTEKLDLTGDQQARIKPILQELHDATQKPMQDESMSREERLDSVRPWHERADKEIREILNDDQKNKLDQLEREPHPELHGNLNGATPPPPRPPQI